jgi:hypothetical protein
MRNYLKASLCFVVSFFLLVPAHATKRKVLFIGNSYIYTNNMPLMLQTLAAAQGDTLVYDESVPGGYSLANHCTNATTIAKIFSQQWDLVVLQDQSELPSFPPAQVATDVYPYAHKLDSMIHANDSCTQTMFLMTWGHANGDPLNCGFYPVICTYAGMQGRLRTSYMEMTHDNHAVLAPVGIAWKAIMDSFPSIWLYMADSSHPVVPGSYLESCVLYSSIFHKKTFGSSYTSGLTVTVANTLQAVADRVVFDSLNQWQQYGHYPYAGFTKAGAGSTIAFTNHDPVGADYYWAFGDGGHDTAANTTHTYASSGTYVVRHTAITNCFTETLTDTVRLGTTLIDELAAENSAGIRVLQEGNGNVRFLLPEDKKYEVMEVYDAQGRQVKKYSVTANKIADKFVAGLYIYKAYSGGRAVTIGKLVVY